MALNRFPRREEVFFMTGMIAAATVVSLPLRSQVHATNMAMLYLLAVVAIAIRCSRGVSVAASFLGVLSFDFFCLPPYFTLRVEDVDYVITLVGVLAVALVISTQTAQIRMQAKDALDREKRTQTLYHLSQILGSESRVLEAAQLAARTATDLFRAEVTIFLPEKGRISFTNRTSDSLPVPRSEEAIAQEVFNEGKERKASALYFPLQGADARLGVMAVVADREISTEEYSFLYAFANHTALALERTRAHRIAEETRVNMQAEEMRSSLLSAVSHDLRTPLASITGAASTLRSQFDKLSPQTRAELLDSISEEAERLSRLVGNLLDMTRLQSGIELRRELCPLEEIVGAALQRMEQQLDGRKVITVLPDSLPPILVDDVLIGQVMSNLLENAVKYTPSGTEIEIAAQSGADQVTVEVRDRGPGFRPGDETLLFTKFFRGRSEGVRGAGLGLAICRAIVQAHRGTIEALNRPGGGAIFRITLPMEDPS